MKLTICSVIYKNVDCVNINIDFISRYLDMDITWYVALNHPDDIAKLDRRFIQLSGAAFPQKLPRGKSKIEKSSYHHADALNTMLKTVVPQLDSQYLLIMDPDFFIVPSLHGILAYMDHKQLDFFGAPYHPDRKRPENYFPTAICMFVNSSTIDITSFDFTPERKEYAFYNEPYSCLADTGYKVYTSYRRSAKYEITPFDNYKRSFYEEYVWKGSRFGLHFRMRRGRRYIHRTNAELGNELMFKPQPQPQPQPSKQNIKIL